MLAFFFSPESPDCPRHSGGPLRSRHTSAKYFVVSMWAFSCKWCMGLGRGCKAEGWQGGYMALVADGIKDWLFLERNVSFG